MTKADTYKSDISQIDETQRMSPFKKFVMFMLCLAIILGMVLLAFAIIRLNEEPESKKRPFNTLAVMATPATQEDIKLTVNVQGEAGPQIEIDLVPQVGGKIVYVSPNFIDGGIFKKGETLIRIDPADFNVNIARVQSSVASAEQALARERAEGEIARRDYEELGTGTPSDLALRRPQQAQAQAALDAAKAELDGARLQLARTSVRAPFDGRVRSKSSDLGQFVSPGSRLGRIFSTDITEVRLALTDTDLSKLDLPVAYVAKARSSAPAVTLSATIGEQRREWQGRIMRTDSTYDTMTRALTAIVEVVDPYGKGASEGGVPLAPGLFVDAQIEGRTFKNAIVFPRDGLRPENEVYVVDEKGKADIRKAVVLDTNANRAVVSAGVAPGELIVLSPMEKSRLSMNMKVLDINDPKTVLVDPEEPEWMKKSAEDEADEAPKGFFAKLFPKKDVDPDAIDRGQRKDLLEALSADYAKIMRDMSDEEKLDYNKLDAKGKAALLRKKLADMPAARRDGKDEALTSGAK